MSDVLKMLLVNIMLTFVLCCSILYKNCSFYSVFYSLLLQDFDVFFVSPFVRTGELGNSMNENLLTCAVFHSSAYPGT